VVKKSDRRRGSTIFDQGLDWGKRVASTCSSQIQEGFLSQTIELDELKPIK